MPWLRSPFLECLFIYNSGSFSLLQYTKSDVKPKSVDLEKAYPRFFFLIQSLLFTKEYKVKGWLCLFGKTWTIKVGIENLAEACL